MTNACGLWFYRRVGYDNREIELLPGGSIGIGSAENERQWTYEDMNESRLTLHGDNGLTCKCVRHCDGVFRGFWVTGERMAIELTRISQPRINPSFSFRVPVIGIPTLLGTDMLDRCIASILVGTIVPDAIIVIDNGGR